MTTKQANNDKHFEPAPRKHILRTIDRMRRTNAEAASSLAWFPVMASDAGCKAEYFNEGWGFEVQKRKDDAPIVKS